MSEERTCKKCGETKPIEQFGFTGKGYVRWTCRLCDSQYAAIYYRRNVKRKRKLAKKWIKNNPEKVLRTIQKHELLHRFKRCLSKSRAAAKKYGYAACIATEREIKEAFDGKCHTCGIAEIECSRRLCMDHDHITGAFRGWLCTRCNKVNALAEM